MGFGFSVTKVDFGSRSSTVGPIQFSLRSNQDSYSSDLSFYTGSTINTWERKFLPNLTFASTSATTFRIYGYGYPSTGSLNNPNWKVDDVIAYVFTSVPSPSNVNVNHVGATGNGTVTWTLPSGYDNTINDHIVFVKAGSPIVTTSSLLPTNNYTANTVLGLGTAHPSDPAAHCVYKGDGTTVSISGGIPNGTTQYYAVVYNSAQTTTFSIPSSSSGALLPVELKDFSYSRQKNRVLFAWSTATEINNYGFEIQKSLDENNWERARFVQGSGNSNIEHKYSFNESNYKAGRNYYRLKQIDNDGSYKYSGLLELNLEAPAEFSLEQNYPNPFNPSTKVDYQLAYDAKVTIDLFNITGEKVAELLNTEQGAGYYSLDIKAGDLRLASGVYIYRMITHDKVNAGMFTQLKKMVLLK